MKVRQIIKNKIQRASIRPFTPKILTTNERKKIYKLYFAEENKKLELLIGRKMNWEA